ncbi:DNA adenine methylase [Faucicola boevrei]|uniref:DNA adenine methylase n=1 Tax=Faucicola boevrei TaxID=346665 RepID=UPI0003625106|nr:DNA adenine methylase [Moraxella boevrei]
MKKNYLKPTYNPKGNSFSGWLGGKHKLARTIIDIMPEHKHYIEVFAGASWVLFKKSPSYCETINDINGELINFYRVVKYHFEALSIELENTPISRDLFTLLKNTDPNSLTDIQRASRFYYLLKLAFGNKLTNQSYSPLSDFRPRLDIAKELKERLSQVHERLKHVNIENLHFSQLIKRYDKADVLFYLDPPYYQTEDYYGKDVFGRDDFIVLRDLLLNIKGKFILSINDLPETRAIFKDFFISTRQIRWSLNSNEIKSDNNGKELIITNFRQ